MKRSKTLSLIAGVFLMGAMTVTAGEIDVSGKWKLNRDKSDRIERPQRRTGEARGEMRSRGDRGGSRGMRGAGPGAAGMRGARPGDGAEGPGRGPGPMLSDTLVLSQANGTLVFTNEDGRERTFHLNGEAQTTVGFRGEEMQVIARNEGNAIVIERTSEDRPPMTETFELSDDGKVLTVTRLFPGPDGDRTVTQVYNREE